MLKILKYKNQIEFARRIMKTKGISCVESISRRILRKMHISHHLPVGDLIKSWDVLETINLIEEKKPRSSFILDIGAYCSELPVSLGRLGYSNVYAIDLNPNIKKMPLAGRIKYEIGNFMSTPFASEMFDVVTSISVIEHGYDPEKLFREVSRILKPGGEFIASFDYWPDKIDTGNTKFFGMSWLIFSKTDVADMLNAAARFGLEPAGEIDPTAADRTIHCLGYDYTFAWIVLRKKA